MIPAVILAAGLSTRMGRPKALLPIGDETFVTHLIRTFRDAGVDDVLVIVGHEAEAVAAQLDRERLDVRVVFNADYESGQLSSVLAGLNAIDRPGVKAMLMSLVDVPFVAATTVRAVIARYRETGARVVRPVHGEKHGHPVLIDRSLFDMLRAADPGTGIKPIIRAHVSTAGDVPVDDEGSFIDVDTPEEYEEAARRMRSRR